MSRTKNLWMQVIFWLLLLIVQCVLLAGTDTPGKTVRPNQVDTAQLGDIDGNGQIDSTDASRILMAVTHIGLGMESELTAQQEQLADVNSDGSMDVADASIILIYSSQSGLRMDDMTLYEFIQSRSGS